MHRHYQTPQGGLTTGTAYMSMETLGLDVCFRYTISLKTFHVLYGREWKESHGGASKVAFWAQTLAMKPGDLRLIPRNCMMEGSHLHAMVCPPPVSMAGVHTPPPQ